MATDKKSICFIIPRFVTFSTGGAELQVHNLSQQFLKMGWHVELVCRGSNHQKQIKESPFCDPRIRYRYYPPSPLLCFEFFSVFWRLCQTRTFWLYNRTDDAATAAMVLFARLTGKKSIYALACDDDASLGKYRNLYKQIRYKNILKRWLRLADAFILDGMIEWAKRKSSLVFCQTASQEEAFEKNFHRPAEIVPNSFNFTNSTQSEKENIVLWVGNFRATKQPAIFLEIAQQLRHHENWQFVMIGEPDEATRPLLEQMDHLPNFTCLGSLSYGETHHWFQKAKIYINTSSIEGFPNTFIQAWLSKCHILSLNSDPDGLLTRKGLGQVFHNQMEALTSHLDQRLHQPCEMDGNLDEAYCFAKHYFDIHRNSQKMLYHLNNTNPL